MEVLAFLALGLLMFPAPAPSPSYQTTGHFVINPPMWSTFYELLANAIWAVLAPKLTIKVLLVIVAVSATTLGIVEHHYPSYRDFGVDNLLAGIPRTVLPYTLGVLAFRLHERGLNPFKAPPFVVMLMLAGVLLTPVINNVAFDLACHAFLPVILLAGIGGRQPEGAAAKASLWLGDISYPLYVLHWPLGLVLMDVFRMAGVHYLYMPYMVAVMGIVFLISWAAIRFCDDPMRLWLTDLLKPRQKTVPAGRWRAGTKRPGNEASQ
jgi:peptidoglycan/LPS O-acetylase OafA/YrhL